MSDDLKPVRCGCGGEAKVISYLRREYCKMAYYVRCENCGTETDDLHSEAEAITAWNRAMGADKVDELIEHIWREKLDTREKIAELVKRMLR